VSTLMRNVEASPWLGQPELVEIKLVTPTGTRAPTRSAASPERLNEFTMNLQVKRTMPPLTAVAPAAATKGPAAPAPAKGGAPAKAAPPKGPGAAVKADAGRKGANA